MTLGPWQAIGPLERGLRHRPAVFRYAVCAEKDVLGASFGPVDLSRSYEAVKFPGMLETKRAWQPHPEWIDGYRHLLPRGPARRGTSRATCCARSRRNAA